MPRRRAPIVAVTAAACCAVSACGGGSDYANKPRPPAPINVSAAISTKKVSLSPRTFGAGPIVMVISNQTNSPQVVTLQTQELGGSNPGIKETSNPIGPQATGTMQVEMREGNYSVSAKGGVTAASLKVGKQRASAQDQLLQP